VLRSRCRRSGREDSIERHDAILVTVLVCVLRVFAVGLEWVRLSGRPDRRHKNERSRLSLHISIYKLYEDRVF
jgi:hypothetical protein